VDLLEDLDWGTPHLMVQRDGGGDILHAFVPISAADAWAWEEVPLAVDPAAVKVREAFRFLSAGEPAAAHGTEGPEALWRRVERELRTVRPPGKDRT
jgi:hypothetical protein